jgi:hypothetical protein
MVYRPWTMDPPLIDLEPESILTLLVTRGLG